MKYLNYLLLLCFCLLLWACPYESDVPVDEPNIPVDTGLFGKWKHVNDENSYATISLFGNFVYRLVYNSWTTEHRSYEVKMFTAHMSVLSGKLFINVRPDMKTGGSYHICEFEVNQGKDTLRLLPISQENKKKFTNSVELREWMLKRLKKKNFLDKEEVFVKVP